jgi:hypothetical protein
VWYASHNHPQRDEFAKQMMQRRSHIWSQIEELRRITNHPRQKAKANFRNFAPQCRTRHEAEDFHWHPITGSALPIVNCCLHEKRQCLHPVNIECLFPDLLSADGVLFDPQTGQSLSDEFIDVIKFTYRLCLTISTVFPLGDQYPPVALNLYEKGSFGNIRKSVIL